MICISVTPQSRRFAKADLLNASRQCDLIELCLDQLLKPPDMADLLSAVDNPVLVSCRRTQDGGQWQGSEEERLTLLRQSIVAEPAFIELDLEIAAKVPRYGSTQRVINYTSLYEPLGRSKRELEEVFERAEAVDADVVKFTWPTASLEAAWPLLAAVSQKRDRPVVGMGLGSCGLTFSLLGRKYGSPWLYAALERGMEAYEGQPTVGDLDEIHRWRTIGSKTQFIAVDGFDPPTLTMVSLFNRAADEEKLNVRLLPLTWENTDRLKEMFEALKINGVIGRLQGESRLAELADEREEAIAAGGSVDLLLKKDTGWTAYGCVWRSALSSLEAELGGESEGERPLDRRNVMVVGSGGLARALVFGVRGRKGLVSVSGSDDQAAQQLAADLDVRFVPSQNLYDTLADIVVLADENLVSGPGRGELNPAFLRPPMLVLDAGCLDQDSPLLTEARERGCRIVEPSVVWRGVLKAVYRSLTGRDLPGELLDEVLGS